MLRNDIFSAGMVSFYLFIYCILLQFETTFSYAMGMLLFSPCILAWMIYTILKHGKYTGEELGDQEYGYQDKMTGKPGIC